MSRYEVLIKEITTRFNELNSYINAITTKPPDTKNKFFIFAHYRSGSTLLSSLLDLHPDVKCEREIFLPYIFLKYKKVLSPELIIKSRLLQCENENYGFILRFAQLQKILYKSISKPNDFLDRLYSQNWKIIHLKRNNPLKQAISNQIQLIRGQSHDTKEKPLNRTAVTIDPEKLISNIEWMKKTSREEDLLLANYKHIKVIYEKELLHSEFHQETINRVFEFLDLEAVPVSAELNRVSTDNIGEYIENFEEINEFIKNTEYSKYLYED